MLRVQNLAPSKTDQGTTEHCSIHLRWVPTGAQLADCLTKIMDNSVIRAVLKYGVYKLFDEGEILRKRANTRTRMQWLRQNLEKPSRPEAVEATS